MTEVLTDEVWRQLNPVATRLPRRTRVRLAVLGVVVVLLLVAECLLAASGEARPSLSIDTWDVHIDLPEQHSFVVTAVVTNDDWVDDHIAFVDSADPYVDGYYPGSRRGEYRADGLVIPAHSRRTIDLRFWVRDCARARRSFDT